MRYYYLDDVRPNPDPKKFKLFQAAPDLIQELQSLDPNLHYVYLDLDHDLGICDQCLEDYNDGQTHSGFLLAPSFECVHRGCGMDVLIWLEEQAATNPDFWPPEINIHTANASAGIRMAQAVKSIYKKKVTCQRCNQEGVIELIKGFISERMQDWYWSDNNECFYCKPCEDQMVTEMFGELVDLCNDKNVPVVVIGKDDK